MILKLETQEGTIQGHKKCSDYIIQDVKDLLENLFLEKKESQETLLKEIEEVFIDKYNEDLLKVPTEQEVKEVLKESNLHAAPGSDGLTS